MLILLFLLWLILNGAVTLEICLIGVPVALAGYGIACAVTGWNPRRDLQLLRLGGLLCCYVAVLVREIIKAAWGVFTVILHPKKQVHQTLVTFETGLERDFTRALLANSITLTPGTITVSVDGSCYTVHCLDSTMIEGIRESDFMRLLQKMEAVKL